MDPMQLLSRIYDILSQCSSKELERAARMVGEDTALFEALQSLAVYKRSSPQNQKSKTRSPKVRTPKKPAVQRRPPSLDAKSSQATNFSSNGLRKKFMSVVLNKEVFKTNRDVVEYFKKSSIPIQLSHRESRERILNKVLRWLDSLPLEEQKEAYRVLLQILAPSETAGWFDVIRGSKS